MKIKTIVFTDVGKADLLERELVGLKANEVLIETEYTAVSAGTERACLMLMPNLGDERDGGIFPKILGYSGVGIVKELGVGVTNVSVGDRVLINWGVHAAYNVRPAEALIKVGNGIDPKHAAFSLISIFPAAGVRKTRLEFGESAMVIGMGILGAFAVQYCRLAGAYPVIVADLDERRRQLALDLGADYAFNPMDGDYIEKVKAVTRDGKGVNAIVEVTGQAVALAQALDCAAPFGRVSLLGCTRVSNAPIDFYQQVHRPGVEIIGAHTDARPKLESRPHCWTECDDCKMFMDFVTSGRLDMSKILTEVHSPADASEVFRRLAENKDFPIGVTFDWSRLKK